MTDDSPIALRIKTNGKHYIFFQFVLAINDIVLFDKDYGAASVSPDFKEKFDFEQYHKLQSKFNQSLDDINSTTELSLIQISSLLSIVDHIAKALLIDDADKLNNFKSNISAEFPGISNNWDKDFFKNAQYVFDSMKENFKNISQFNDLIKTLTGQ